jgi:hypothetical protein
VLTVDRAVHRVQVTEDRRPVWPAAPLTQAERNPGGVRRHSPRVASDQHHARYMQRRSSVVWW